MGITTVSRRGGSAQTSAKSAFTAPRVSTQTIPQTAPVKPAFNAPKVVSTSTPCTNSQLSEEDDDIVYPEQPVSDVDVVPSDDSFIHRSQSQGTDHSISQYNTD